MRIEYLGKISDRNTKKRNKEGIVPTTWTIPSFNIL
ncbi:hypothetical protein SAMN05444405_11670 [Bacteroides luti]|uniref:Uncharacterized protein n=1 Tax=Bacteroides luti TaxID=1297750 RepID=A0A1M5FEH6_9BACE|nr:hypothetical protein SAMN05444405_11670 [Bacteroides luti]